MSNFANEGAWRNLFFFANFKLYEINLAISGDFNVKMTTFVYYLFETDFK